MNSPQPNHIDVYEIVTNQIIELLKAGTVPWQQPWAAAGPPMNMLSKRPYRGINLWLLLSLQYENNLFLTWDQLKSIGGSVNQGEHGHVVVFWKNIPKKPEELDKDQKPKRVPMLRYYKVFNLAQCKDIPKELIPVQSTEVVEPLLECENIINTMPQQPEIRHKEARAYYNMHEDFINMPKQKSFKPVESYYSTLFHELIHWTGAEKRLARKTLFEMMPFGSQCYAMEELIAEMGSAFLCQFAGILPNEITQIAAYLNNWLTVFEKDKRFLILAAGQAQKATDFILGKIEEDSKEKNINSMGTVVS